jgi:nucleoside-diphosphate-sugar epimerase
VDDVAEGHVAALERGEAGGEYELGGENAPQMRVFEIVRDLTGAPLPRRIAFPLAVLVAWLEEGRTRLTGQAPRLTRRTVEIFRHDWSLDSSRAAAALGYRITPLTAGIRAVLDARSAPT